jgi:hypothetical protein
MKIIILAALGLVCAAAPAQAQKYETNIPPAIVAPDSFDTRLGVLKFKHGVPDDATVQKVYDNLDFQRGVQAFLSAMPAASLVAMRNGIRSFGPDNQTVIIFETLMDSRSLFLTANTESIYTLAWIDLKNGPVVIESPPNTLGLFDDFWFRYVADLGNAGPDKGQGGKFLFLPPGYNGSVPDGYYVYKSPTFGNWFVTRGFQVKGDPKPGVDSIKAHLRIYPLAGANNPPSTNFVNVSGKAFNTIHAMDFSYFEEVNQVIQEEPTTAMDPETLGVLASIGIEHGKPFAPDERMKKILIEAAAVGSATVRALTYRSQEPDAYLYPNSAWQTPFIGGSYEFLRNGARLLDARSFFFFLATGITPAWRFRRPAQDHNTRSRSGTRRASPSTAARPIGFICRQTFRPRISGRLCFTTPRPVRCSRPINSFQASAARKRASWSIPTHPWMCTSAPRRRPARKATGCKRGPARAGWSSCVYTVQSKRFSTRVGSRARSRR